MTGHNGGCGSVEHQGWCGGVKCLVVVQYVHQLWNTHTFSTLAYDHRPI